MCRDCLEGLGRISPPVCRRCGKKIGYEGLCADCAEKGESRGHWIFRRAAILYDDTNAFLIKKGKYGRDIPLLNSLAETVAEAYGLYFEGINADAVAAVPLNRKKRLRRGFNQAEILARAIPLPGLGKRVSRTADTLPQSGMDSDKARKGNVKGVFGVYGDIRGKTLIIVDDVITSGATTDELASVLKKAGAERVYILALSLARS